MQRELTDLKIYLLDINPKMCKAWERCFAEIHNVEIICADFTDFMNSHKNIDCIVSPANAYGLMDGGYDLAITKFFGNDLQKKVQKYIIENLYGEQPIGTSIIIDTDKDEIKLIHAPTMRTPSKIIDYTVIYHCMRSALITALNNGVKNMVIPAFGACTGGVHFDIVTELMWRAYLQLATAPKELNWEYAQRNSLN